MDRYTIRRAIFDFLGNNRSRFKGILLDVGCGAMPYKNFIQTQSAVEKYLGVDLPTTHNYDKNVQPDYTWDGNSLPFETDFADTVLLTEVLEHCPEPLLVLREIRRVLKTNGVLVATVPFLWPLHEVPHDAYRYTPFTLKRLLVAAGFSQVQILPHGGWHQALAAIMGLWVKRGVSNTFLRKILRIPVLWMMKILLKKDKNPKSFSEGQMCLGFGIIAQK